MWKRPVAICITEFVLPQECVQNQSEVSNSLGSIFIKMVIIIILLQHAENNFGMRKQYCQYFQRT